MSSPSTGVIFDKQSGFKVFAPLSASSFRIWKLCLPPSSGNDRGLAEPHRRPCPLEALSGVKGLRLWGPKDVVAEGEGLREGSKTSQKWTVLLTELTVYHNPADGNCFRC